MMSLIAYMIKFFMSQPLAGEGIVLEEIVSIRNGTEKLPRQTSLRAESKLY